MFSECVLRPMTVRGGQWQGVTVRAGNLAKLDLTGPDLREADLSMSDLTATVLAGAVLLAELQGADVDSSV